MRMSDWSSDVCSSDLLDLKRLAELHLSPTQVLAVIQADNINVPGGAVEAGTRRFNIKTSGSYHSVQQVLATVIAGNGAKAVHVADVASVRRGAGPLESVAPVDGKRAVYVTATQKNIRQSVVGGQRGA